MDINYELYKVFYYVADTLSFSEASKQLFISQSAVSQSIKALEKKLDQVLFIRSTKKVQLTPEGEILLRHIEPAINLIKRGESQIMETASTGGQIRIGASDTICRYFLVPYLERFQFSVEKAYTVKYCMPRSSATYNISSTTLLPCICPYVLGICFFLAQRPLPSSMTAT